MQIDPLSDVLSLLRPHTYVAGGFDLQGRWSIGFDAHTGIKCYAVLSGHCRIVVDGVADPVALDAGDCVLLPNGRPFALSSDLSLPPVPFTDLHAIEWHGGIATLHGGGETLILGGHFGEAWMHAASRRSASRRALANGFGAGWPNIHRQHHAGFCLGIARSHGRAASRITVLSNGLMSPSLWFGSRDIAEQVGHHRHLWISSRGISRLRKEPLILSRPMHRL